VAVGTVDAAAVANVALVPVDYQLDGHSAFALAPATRGRSRAADAGGPPPESTRTLVLARPCTPRRHVGEHAWDASRSTARLGHHTVDAAADSFAARQVASTSTRPSITRSKRPLLARLSRRGRDRDGLAAAERRPERDELQPSVVAAALIEPQLEPRRIERIASLVASCAASLWRVAGTPPRARCSGRPTCRDGDRLAQQGDGGVVVTPLARGLRGVVERVREPVLAAVLAVELERAPRVETAAVQLPCLVNASDRCTS